jgi:NADPH:quinone reductase-like Zn-dependent oxidoreductase
MKAVIMNEHGNENVLNYTNALRPESQSDEVLVKVHAALFNQVDVKIRDGLWKKLGLQPPLSFCDEHGSAEC